MALGTPRTIFGITNITPYHVSSQKPYGTARVLSSSNFEFSGEVVSLHGGSSKWAWQNEDSTLDGTLEIVMREVPDWLFQLVYGKAVTTASAASSGTVSSIANALNTSCFDATTGIASVTAGATTSDLKFGKYTAVVAAGGTTVDLFCNSFIDFGRGTDVSYDDDLLAIESGVAVTDSSGTTAIADFGLTITGGSGTVAMTVGDSATFEVLPVNTGGSTEVTIGATTDTFPSWGCELYAQAQGSGNGRMIKVDIFECKAIGGALPFTANDFGEITITAKVSYNDTRGGVFKITEVVL